MKMLAASKEIVIAESVIIEVIRISKLCNPTAMIGITEDDIDYLIKNLARDYLMHDCIKGKQILDAAVSEFFSLSQRENKVNLGDFIRLCYAQAAQAREDAKTKQLIEQRSSTNNMSVVQKNLTEFRQILNKALQPLPYDKNFRVTGDVEIQMSCKKEKEHLAAKHLELHDEIASCGQIMPLLCIDDPELQNLYHKAWTGGLTKEESARFYELAPKSKPKRINTNQ